MSIRDAISEPSVKISVNNRVEIMNSAADGGRDTSYFSRTCGSEVDRMKVLLSLSFYRQN